MDDDTEDDLSSTDNLKYSLIPDTPYPLVTEGTLNYGKFSVSQTLNPKKAVIKTQ